ncbi:hypothetical protein [Aureimonas endophytica]|nr:hypothetical protein [Aureimonas endophytica]
MDRTLAWTVEEVARNSRPSPIQVQFGGWLINASGGPVRRINATTPTEHRSVAPDILIGAAETIYDALGRAAIFKVLSVADEIDAALAARNYRIEAESLVLFAPALPPS